MWDPPVLEIQVYKNCYHLQKIIMSVIFQGLKLDIFFKSRFTDMLEFYKTIPLLIIKNKFYRKYVKTFHKMKLINKSSTRYNHEKSLFSH